MKYRQLTSGERYQISVLRRQGYCPAEIARALGRHRSTITREIARNSRQGCYRPSEAIDFTRWRRSWSRRNAQFTDADLAIVWLLLQQLWSPDQISGRLKLEGGLRISHETIYRRIWSDKNHGGLLFKCLRGAQKKKWKRYRSKDSRGRLAGKRMIEQRPAGAENRSRFGHLEGDTMIGTLDKHCILTLVCRKSGHVMIGKLRGRTTAEVNRRAAQLLAEATRPVRTITVDNGTEFHGYKDLERKTGATIYFANPHHSWERGTSENTNGLIRQYVPKKVSMSTLTQRDCTSIADALNNRPRKRLGYRTPKEVYESAAK